MVLAFDEVLSAIRARQGITPVTLPDGQQLQIEDYPMAAIREAVANALIHGDWRARVPVSIEHSAEYLRVTSPGPLVSGITIHNILTKGSRARYPALTSSFRLLGLAEEVGHVVVLFKGQPPNTRITKFLASLSQEEQTKLIGKSLNISVITAKSTIGRFSACSTLTFTPLATS